MLSYKVQDLDRFFILFDFGEDEEAEIRQRFGAGDEIFVHQDGSVTIERSHSEELVPPDEELLDEDSFVREAEKMGSEVVFAGEGDDLANAEVEEEETVKFS